MATSDWPRASIFKLFHCADLAPSTSVHLGQQNVDTNTSEQYDHICARLGPSGMATPEDLARWVAAVECYSAADIQGALDLFSPMSGYSKIAFNLGMLHLEQKDYKRALESLDKAVVSDKYMAVAHFQKAYIHFLLDELGTAEKEYTLSLNVWLSVLMMNSI